MNRARLGVRLDTSLETLLHRAPAADGRCVLATVVATAGSTYRKSGARMLVMADGSYHGLLSGGCLEADLGLHAREVLMSGVARAVEYDMRGPDDILFGIGAGCEGAMRVLLEPAGAATPAAAALAQAGAATHAGGGAVLTVLHESAVLPLGTYAVVPAGSVELHRAAAAALHTAASRDFDLAAAGGRLRAFVQYLAPPPHLLLCGAGPDAVPVARAAVDLGWRVSVVDHRPAYAQAARFPDAFVQRADAERLRSSIALDACHAVVVMSHHLPSDLAYLRELAAAGVPEYVGLLGPAARRRRIADELGTAATDLQSRLRGPVGIDIGAETPAAIALCIVAEIHAWLAPRRPASWATARSSLDSTA